jgi:4a-hydroxytetrahydrobiopterin dehydratase
MACRTLASCSEKGQRSAGGETPACAPPTERLIRRRVPVPDAPRRLSEEEIELTLSQLAGWQIVGGKLHREYRFRDFVEAWGFMSSAALIVQQMDHHPEWFNVYHTVRIDLVTHDAGGISPRDVELARKLEALAARHLRPA